jgi:hypothetical protein
MRTKAITINIAYPCIQNWDLMENINTERFCETCQKCVIDFSNYSNAEIVKIITSSKNDICGRLTNTQLAQLNHYHILVPAHNNWLKYLGVLAIGTSLLLTEAKATSFKEPIPITNLKYKTNSKIDLPKKIYGYVFDEHKKPISGIRLVVPNTKFFAQTDKNGRYEIVLNDKFNAINDLIKVESLNFEGSTKINYSAARQADLHLKVVYMIMGKIEISRKN